MNPGSIYSELTGKIGSVRRKEHGLALQTAVINALTVVIAVWTLAVTIEVLGELDAAGRTALYWGAVVLSGIGAAWLLALPFGRLAGLIRSQDDDVIARRVGSRIPEIGDRLVNTLQLYRSLDGTAVLGYSPELMEASIAVEGEPLRHYDYGVIIERDDRKRALLFFLSAVTVVSALFLGFPGPYRGALYRLTHYNQVFLKPALFTLTVLPGDREVVRGDSVAIRVLADGVMPRTVKLAMRAEGQSEFEEYELRADSLGRFDFTVPGVKGTTVYYAESGTVRTEEHTLRVVDRPEIRLFQATVTPPGYTGRRPERLPENTGDVSGLRGTAVNLEVTASVPPAKAYIVQLFPRGVQLASASAGVGGPTGFDTVRIPMRIEGTRITGGFRLSRDGQYYVSLVSAQGLGNTSPIHYGMSVSSDGAPSIVLVEPTGKAEVDEKMILPTQVQISDDYGFSYLRLFYRISASKYGEPMAQFKSISVPIPRGGIAAVDVPYVWSMAGTGMGPEDEVELYFEVADNDVVTGPKKARTGAITVRFPSFEEVLEKAEEMQVQATADLNKVLQEAQESRRQMEELNRELMKQLAQNQGQANWQQQQQLQQLMKQHEQMQQKLENVAQDLRAMAEKLQEAKAISPETLQKYQELQQLFQEIKNEDLLRSMQEMQRAMEKLTPEQMAEAMKNFKFDEEQFRQAIERTMKVLERMQTEQKVDEMIRRTEKLAQEQEKINKEMSQISPEQKADREQLAERQQDLAKSAEELKKEMEQLAKQMSQQGEEMPNKEMQEAQQSLEQNDPQEKMQEAGEQMQQGDMQQAQKQGEQAKQAAESLKQKMQSVKQKMQQNTQKNVVNKMKKSLQDLLELSKRQEQIKEQTEGAQPNSQQFRDLAQQQQQAQEDLKNITNQMSELSEKTFAVTPEMGKELGDAMRQMQGAKEDLEQRDGFNASQKEGEAMSSMNRAAQMMQQMLAQMQNQQQGQGMGMGMGMGSPQQRLQEMAAQQQMINQAMQQMQQGGQGQQGQGQGQEGEGEGEGKEGKGGKKGKNGEGQGEGENGKNSEQMRRLSQQQDQVKKSLEDLNREIREQGGTRKNMIGDLERAAKEIEEVLRDIQSGNISSETSQRQDRILSRMLDAIRSQRERDFEKNRESKPGIDVTRNSPPDLRLPDPETPESQLDRDALRGREAGYTKDYEYMIRKYFETLGQQRPAGQ